MMCFRKFFAAKKFMDKTGVRVSRFSVENTLSHSSEKFRRRILQCLISFGYRETLGLRGGVGGGVTFFRRSCFCLRVPKHFADEPFCDGFQELSGGEKVYG